MAELIIVCLIAMFVLVVRAKIVSKYNENSYRRDVNRRYREKNDIRIVIREKRA